MDLPTTVRGIAHVRARLRRHLCPHTHSFARTLCAELEVSAASTHSDHRFAIGFGIVDPGTDFCNAI